MSVKKAFVKKIKEAYDMPYKPNKLNEGNFYDKPINIRELTYKKEKIECEQEKGLTDSLTFFEQVKELNITFSSDKNTNDTREIMKNNKKGEYWGKEKFKKLQKYSKQKNKIMQKIKLFTGDDIKNNFKNKIEKGYYVTDKLKAKAVGVKFASESYLNTLFSNLHDLQLETYKLEQGNVQNETAPNKPPPVKKCFSQSDVNFIDVNLYKIWNGYIKLWKNVSTWLNDSIAANFDSYVAKNASEATSGQNLGLNRALYLLFDEPKKCLEDSPCYYNIDKLAEETLTEAKNYGRRILDILKIEKEVRIYDLNTENNKTDPIIIYNTSGGGYPSSGFYMKKDGSVKYSLPNDDIVIEMKFKNIIGKNEKSTGGSIDLKITLNIAGMVTDIEAERKGGGGARLGEKLKKFPLLVSEYNHFGFGIAHINKNRTDVLLQGEDFNNVKKYLSNIGGWLAGQSESQAHATSKKRREADANRKKSLKKANTEPGSGGSNSKKVRKNKTIRELHNETILYAQPVERHYSPMERATYGMDKLELEDVTFKF
tara:strand:- start:3456 stop:5075 length:1620 start_codon:yes stop_codon:yes gene_type:complete